MLFYRILQGNKGRRGMTDNEALNPSHLPPPNPNPCPTPHTPPETRESANHTAEMEQKKKKVVVVMGASGTGKSRLAIDMASLFPLGFAFEVVNADSMQVYRGLDVLTNKVPLRDQKGVPHHLLGTVDANVEFSARDFRDLAVPVSVDGKFSVRQIFFSVFLLLGLILIFFFFFVPLQIIDDILARGHIPVIVGGTNYYIQALVSPYLMDEMVSELDECCISDRKEESIQDFQSGQSRGESISNYDCLKKLDPVAANRIHPNDQRKIARYLALYKSSGSMPSELFRGIASGNWGRAENFRYDCCFLWIDVSLPILDRYVEERVESMMEHGLLNEVLDIYNPSADYTRGLRQAIGVREFEDFSASYQSTIESRCLGFVKNDCFDFDPSSREKDENASTNRLGKTFEMDDKHRLLLNVAVDSLKANTRRLVRRQVRRLKRLQTFFGWKFHYVDATKAFECKSDTYWMSEVVESCVSTVEAFLCNNTSSVVEDLVTGGMDTRELWTQFVCEACGNRILRGAHEWEQHKQGRSHRKRVSHLRKKHDSRFAGVTSQPSPVVQL